MQLLTGLSCSSSVRELYTKDTKLHFLHCCCALEPSGGVQCAHHSIGGGAGAVCWCIIV